ncbi:MAG: class I SAM-dependent methyltransferase [Nanoarchaeota archaeon]
MSVLQLSSDNKFLSFIISKNPETGLTAKSLRKGVVFGYFTEGDNQSYNIFFKDGSDEVSFPAHDKEEDFEYLNTTRYNSASFVVSAIDEVLRSAFKSNTFTTPSGEMIDSGGNFNKFFINMIHVKNKRYIDAFEDYFSDYKVDAELICDNNYKITITTKNSIFELLNFVSLFGIFNAIVNDEPNFINEENIAKYIRCMNIIDAPYFLRYLFKIRFIKGMNTFKKDIEGFGVVKDELSKNRKKKIEMTFGDTWQARQMAIEEKLEFKNDIVDVGCGEGKYITRFSKYMKGKKYFAIDIDDEVRADAERRVKNKGLKDVKFYKSTLEFWSSDDYEKNQTSRLDVICTEVIEHMPVDDAKIMMNDILSLPIDTLIVTTPDVRFNVNYFMEGMRHDDHDWEPTKQEFVDFMEDCFKSITREYTMEWFPIGDVVDGITPSQGIIVKFK